jgi:hypothetical protein
MSANEGEKRVMRNACIFLIATLFTFGVAKAAWAACDGAVSSYNSALSDIESALKRYANCVSSSRGSDDCSSEFRRLRSAQSDFESAVSEYQSECRR